jgi:hypothetical protein
VAVNRAKNLRQIRQSRADGFPPLAESFPESRRFRRRGACICEEIPHDAPEDLQRAGSHLGQGLAGEHPQIIRAAVPELFQQAALSGAGLRFHQHKAPFAAARVRRVIFQLLENVLSPDEGRGAQNTAWIPVADDEDGIARALRKRLVDFLQVGERAPRALVTVARLLVKEVLDHGIKGMRNGPMGGRQWRREGRQMLGEQLCHRIAGKGWAPGQAFEEQRTRGIEIRALVGIRLGQTSRFR